MTAVGRTNPHSERDKGEPLLRIARSRVTARHTLKLSVAAEKNPDRTRTVGWLFYGIVPDPSAMAPANPDAPEPSDRSSAAASSEEQP